MVYEITHLTHSWIVFSFVKEYLMFYPKIAFLCLKEREENFLNRKKAILQHREFHVNEMEEEPMEVYCETVAADSEEIGLEPKCKVEYAIGEDCDEEQVDNDISFDTEAVTNPDEIRIYQNDIGEDDQHMAMEETPYADVNADPTETLQKVLMDQETGLQAVTVKEEPRDEDYVDHGPLESMDDNETKYFVTKSVILDMLNSPPVSASYNELHPVMMAVKPGKATIRTRSGRKSTFLKANQQREMAIRQKGSPKQKKGIRKNNSFESPVVNTFEPHAECLVCKAACTVTKNRKIPSYPFCKRCKKAYFYQQSNANFTSVKGQRRICPKGGFCIIDHQFPKHWCSICHFNKFNKILSTLSTDEDFRNDVNMDRYRSKHRKSNYTEDESLSLMNIALENKPSVIVERMSGKELAAYGIVLEPPVKQETVDVEMTSTQAKKGRARKKVSRREAQKKHPKPKGAPFKSSSSTDTDDESRENMANEDSTYSLPAVNIGHSTIATAVSKSKKKIGPKSKRSTITDQNKKINQPGPSDVNPTDDDYTEVLKSIKVYVFTCGHACGLCNSSKSKEWLKESGFCTAKPVLPTNPNPNATSFILSTPAQKASCTLEKNQQKPVAARNVAAPGSLIPVSPEVLRTLLEANSIGKQQSCSNVTPSISSIQNSILQKQPGPSATVAAHSNQQMPQSLILKSNHRISNMPLNQNKNNSILILSGKLNPPIVPVSSSNHNINQVLEALRNKLPAQSPQTPSASHTVVTPTGAAENNPKKSSHL